MKMLTGLLTPSEGTATLFGSSVEAGSLEVRNNLGYMTQAFSLYEELTIRQNLILDARLYHLTPDEARARIEELVARFGLGPHLDSLAGELPMGLKQRLSLAVAVLHEPKLLILDEPTSGVDPIARDSFWELLVELSRKEGVTIFVTTHFMNEGMRCDRISLMHAGRVLACDAPERLIEARGAKSLEEAFIGYMEDAIATSAVGGVKAEEPAPAPSPASVVAAPPPLPSPPARPPLALPLRRLLAYSRNEAIQILRDPVRLAFAFVGSALLMLVFGFGITTDVEHIRWAAFDRDRTTESRAYLEEFRAAPRYFRATPPVYSDDAAMKRLQSDDVSLVIEIPPNFGHDERRGASPEVSATVDGAMPFRGETVAQYVRGVHSTYLQDPGNGLGLEPPKLTARFAERFMYNPTFESIYAIVPNVPALLLILIPAILMTVSIVREKELGSIINFYVTPTGRLEYLLGKQLPYVAIGMINFFILAALAVLVFGVSVKGSFLMLTACTLLYLLVTTAIGMVTSTFTRTQVAAVFITAILTIQPTVQFAGLLQPVSTLEGSARVIGAIWPTTYYMHSSLGAYTKGLSAGLMVRDLVVLAIAFPILLAISTFGLKKQDK
jgi:ribosome-dependent ATPase